MLKNVFQSGKKVKFFPQTKYILMVLDRILSLFYISGRIQISNCKRNPDFNLTLSNIQFFFRGFRLEYNIFSITIHNEELYYNVNIKAESDVFVSKVE